jgi:hypothetical protein
MLGYWRYYYEAWVLPAISTAAPHLGLFLSVYSALFCACIAAGALMLGYWMRHHTTSISVSLWIHNPIGILFVPAGALMLGYWMY